MGFAIDAFAFVDNDPDGSLFKMHLYSSFTPYNI
jgi:hypothetical protein